MNDDLDLSALDDELDLSALGEEEGIGGELTEAPPVQRGAPPELDLATHSLLMGADVPIAGLVEAIPSGVPGSPEFGQAFRRGMESRQQDIASAREDVGPAKSLLIDAAGAAAPAGLLSGGRLARTAKASGIGGAVSGGMAASEGADAGDVVQAASLGALGGGIGGLAGAGAGQVTKVSPTQRLRDKLARLKGEFKKTTIPEVSELVSDEALPLRLRMTSGAETPSQAIESVRRAPEIVETDLQNQIAKEFKDLRQNKSPEAAVRYIKDKIIPQLEKSKETAIKARENAFTALEMEGAPNVFSLDDRATLSSVVDDVAEKLRDLEKGNLARSTKVRLDEILVGMDAPDITAADSLKKLQEARTLLDSKIEAASDRGVKRHLRELRRAITDLMHSDKVRDLAPDYVESDAQFRRFYEGVEQAKKLGAGQYDEMLPGKFRGYVSKTPDYEKGLARTRGEPTDIDELRKRAQTVRASTPAEIPSTPESATLESLQGRLQRLRGGEIPEGVPVNLAEDLELQQRFGRPIDVLATRDVSRSLGGGHTLASNLTGLAALAGTGSASKANLVRALAGQALNEQSATKVLSSIAEAERRLVDSGVDPTSPGYLAAIRQAIEAAGVGLGTSAAETIAREYLRE